MKVHTSGYLAAQTDLSKPWSQTYHDIARLSSLAALSLVAEILKFDGPLQALVHHPLLTKSQC